MVIVGAGPAGMCAAMYAGRSMLRTVIIERGASGGELLNTEIIEDYPGFEHVEGWDLAMKFESHAKKFGAEFAQGTVTAVRRLETGGFETTTDDGQRYLSPVVIATAGGTPVKLNVPGEVGVCRQRRVVLRRLRRCLLQGAHDRGDRRRRRRHRGSRLSHPLRREGVPDPPPRRAARVEDPPEAPLRQSEDRGDLEQGGRAHRRRRAGTGDGSCSCATR